jgi:hypothetical protein
MGNIGQLLVQILIALFAFFVAAPCFLNAVSLFGVQKKFNQTMVDEGIIAAEEIEKIHPKKQVSSIVIAVLLMGILLWLCLRLKGMALIIAILPLLLGFWKFRGVVKFNSLTARKFYSTYQGHLDEKKFDKYIKKNFKK